VARHAKFPDPVDVALRTSGQPPLPTTPGKRLKCPVCAYAGPCNTWGCKAPHVLSVRPLPGSDDRSLANVGVTVECAECDRWSHTEPLWFVESATESIEDRTERASANASRVLVGHHLSECVMRPTMTCPITDVADPLKNVKTCKDPTHNGCVLLKSVLTATRSARAEITKLEMAQHQSEVRVEILEEQVTRYHTAYRRNLGTHPRGTDGAVLVQDATLDEDDGGVRYYDHDIVNGPPPIESAASTDDDDDDDDEIQTMLRSPSSSPPPSTQE
jgi:hypothetical protein